MSRTPMADGLGPEEYNIHSERRRHVVYLQFLCKDFPQAPSRRDADCSLYLYLNVHYAAGHVEGRPLAEGIKYKV